MVSRNHPSLGILLILAVHLMIARIFVYISLVFEMILLIVRKVRSRNVTFVHFAVEVWIRWVLG
jgi:hypothetical protein